MSRALLFVHGAGCTAAVWRLQVEAFPGARALVLPGHGDGASAHSMADFVTFLHASIEREGCKPPIVIGSSLGGAIAIEHALAYPGEAGAVIVIGSGSRLRVAPRFLEGLERSFDAIVRELGTFMFSSPDHPLAADFVRDMERVGQAQSLRDFQICNSYDAGERLGEISLPFLAITGSKDVMAPPKFGKALAERITGAAYEEVDGAGHLTMLEAPAAVNTAIAGFVGRLG